jgi:hypothetical protein
MAGSSKHMIADLRRFAVRHASAVAVVVLVWSVAGTAATLLSARAYDVTRYLDSGDLVSVACQILPYGVVGAVLLARRPDLPFGWLLALAAMSLVTALALGGPAVVALQDGHGGQLALWGVSASSLMFVPAALEGLVNVRSRRALRPAAGDGSSTGRSRAGSRSRWSAG